MRKSFVIAEIRSDMIRLHARAYARNNPIPKTEREFEEYLFAFSQANNGVLEQMLDRTLNLQKDIQNLSVTPTFIMRREDVKNVNQS